jgi:hypothetical protein
MAVPPLVAGQKLRRQVYPGFISLHLSRKPAKREQHKKIMIQAGKKTPGGEFILLKWRGNELPFWEFSYRGFCYYRLILV